MDYISQVNAPALYLIVGSILAFVTVMCLFFMVRSYRAGVAIGMDKKVLKKTVVSSAVFTVLPSVGILIGVIALSGSLGVPLSWLRLSVVGALQYEMSVADVAAQALGLESLTAITSDPRGIAAFVTIALVMTVGILGGGLCCIFFLGRYLKKLSGKKKDAGAPAEAPAESAEAAPAESAPESAPKKKNNLGNIAMVAMFIGLCIAYLSFYLAGFILKPAQYLPLLVAIIAAAIMYLFTVLAKKPRFRWLENFDIALSMLLAMAAAVVINLVF